MTCLILTQDNDVHAESVKNKILSLGGDAILFKRYSKSNFITYKYDECETSATIKINDKKYNLATDIKSLYWRIKAAIASEITGEQSSVEDRFRMNEWRHVLQSLEDIAPPSISSLNPFFSSFKFYRKPIQLKMAIDLGLKVPKTYISNDSQEICSGMPNHSLIYKTLHAFMSWTRVIYTNKVSCNKIKTSATSIQLAPGIFQELVEKEHELRVTIVGDDVFVAKVDSQKSGHTKLDWRRDQSEHYFSWGNLQKDTKTKLLEFHRQTGLTYATYDFIVKKSGEEVFLECNPNGQWLFLGDEIGNEITTAIAKKLLN